jgi:glycosyltransferase involved in cell wall biosynthesis
MALRDDIKRPETIEVGGQMSLIWLFILWFCSAFLGCYCKCLPEIGVDFLGLTIAAMPAYNEEQSIARMVCGCKKHVDCVVVVDDGSSDQTAEIAASSGAHVVRHMKNRGYGAALQTCFETARDLGAERMVVIDSDGQHDPEEIPKLLARLGRGADLVIGSRFCNGNGSDIPAYRKVGMKVLDIATYLVGGIKVTDSQSGFRAYGRRAIDCIWIDNQGMSAGSEILLQAKDNRLKVEEVDIHCRYDVQRASTEHPVSHGVKILLILLQDMELRRPLYYFTLPGTALAAVGIGIGLELLRVFYHGGQLSYGLTLLMILLTLVGSFMAFTGIILHAISRLIDQSIRKLEIERPRKARVESV